MAQMVIRRATEQDVPLILNFIKELAVYEKMLADVTATEELLRENLFEKQRAEVIIGEVEEQPVAFALFFTNFSTFVGKPGLYLEDLFVKPEFRGTGFGQQILAYLANLAVERNYGRFEWVVLDWNQPSIDFYQKMGAVAMDEWRIFRVSGPALEKLAALEN
ncbi:GNAT family N-acetyltransferase [Enterococcus sp. HY326]|uniref:GNAT family N-acetyltransferase n=1 Tax=Enterococcus sp. HY326 TaxID=2971265 RepID=UPI00223EF5C6|nr:GNAT family N-acetyltransferase [Enterococcus sp. HY326]